MDYFAIHPGGREFPDFREILKRRKRKVFPVAVDKRFMGDYRAHGVFCIGTRRQLRNRHSGIFLIIAEMAVGMFGIAESLLLSI